MSDPRSESKEVVSSQVHLSREWFGVPTPYSEGTFTRSVELGAGCVVTAMLDITSKGNGTLRSLNAEEHVFDVHDDGRVIDGGMADIWLIDLNDDGFRDLLVVGRTLISLNDKSDSSQPGGAFVRVLHFDPLSRAFLVSSSQHSQEAR